MPMKISPVLQSTLAGVGILSLLIYVLACATSFSPDDRQVLYPSFDPQSGAASVAIYDRKASRSQEVFSAAEAAEATNQQPALLRAAWLGDGRHVLIAEASHDHGLQLFVLPRGVNEPVRHFSIPDADEAGATLEFPFAIAEGKLFLNREGYSPTRLDLASGALSGGEKITNELTVLPSPDGKSLVAFRDLKENGMEFGTLDARTMQFNALGNAGTNNADATIPAFDPASGRLMLIAKTGEKLQLQITKNGTAEFSRPLEHAGGELQVGPFLQPTPDGKTVCMAYCAEIAAKTNFEYGLLEIPVSSAPLRFTLLFTSTSKVNESLILAQPSLSHDGQTWAIGTACLYLQDESLKPDDCALFLVDLSKPDRPVTKVPVQVPARRQRLIK
jgi:hypothetical protein